MFLNQLSEQNKERFLQLCFYAALVNKDFAKEEGETIALYCREMGLEPHIPKADANLEDLLISMRQSSDERERKIIFLEILGLFEADGLTDEEEQGFIHKVKELLEIEDEEDLKIKELLKQYTAVYTELCKVIG